jgi:hypothetical protein
MAQKLSRTSLVSPPTFWLQQFPIGVIYRPTTTPRNALGTLDEPPRAGFAADTMADGQYRSEIAGGVVDVTI